METLEERRLTLHLKFALSGIKNDKLNDLLQENGKQPMMETRNHEKFRVDFANTERLKKSCIISMQTKLNTLKVGGSDQR